MTYASAVGKTLLGKAVDVYISDPSMKLKFQDYETSQNSTVSGKLLYADDDLFIIETSVRGNPVRAYVNTYHVIGCVPVEDGVSVDVVFFDTVKPRKR